MSRDSSVAFRDLAHTDSTLRTSSWTLDQSRTNLTLHPLKPRLLAEEFIRLRRADEQRRYASSQRRGRIDPNPHQIDAVVFALRRIPEGGCILADEVGLGKTIEAGLVMAQLLAEGKRRILLIVPKSLLGQWQTDLIGKSGRLRPGRGHRSWRTGVWGTSSGSSRSTSTGLAQ
jgi:SNF2 family DNA or RNA helicase